MFCSILSSVDNIQQIFCLFINLSPGTSGTLSFRRCSRKTVMTSTATTQSTTRTRFVVFWCYCCCFYCCCLLWRLQLQQHSLQRGPGLAVFGSAYHSLSFFLYFPKSQKKSGSVRRHMTSYLSHEVRVLQKLKRDNIQPGEHVHNRSVNAWVRGPRLETDHSLHGRPICKGDACFCVLSSMILLRLEEISLVRFGTTTR